MYADCLIDEDIGTLPNLFKNKIALAREDVLFLSDIFIIVEQLISQEALYNSNKAC